MNFRSNLLIPVKRIASENFRADNSIINGTYTFETSPYDTGFEAV